MIHGSLIHGDYTNLRQKLAKADLENSRLRKENQQLQAELLRTQAELQLIRDGYKHVNLEQREEKVMYDPQLDFNPPIKIEFFIG